MQRQPLVSQVSREHVTRMLAAVETVRQRQGLTRHRLADRLGIPFETFRRWFRTNASRLPSAAHLSRLETYVAKARGEVLDASASDLAREIGWN